MRFAGRRARCIPTGTRTPRRRIRLASAGRSTTRAKRATSWCATQAIDSEMSRRAPQDRPRTRVRRHRAPPRQPRRPLGIPHAQAAERSARDDAVRRVHRVDRLRRVRHRRPLAALCRLDSDRRVVVSRHRGRRCHRRWGLPHVDRLMRDGPRPGPEPQAATSVPEHNEGPGASLLGLRQAPVTAVRGDGGN